MLSINRFKLFSAVLVYVFVPAVSHAQTTLPAGFIHVDAPTAQRLVLAEKTSILRS